MCVHVRLCACMCARTWCVRVHVCVCVCRQDGREEHGQVWNSHQAASGVSRAKHLWVLPVESLPQPFEVAAVMSLLQRVRTRRPKSFSNVPRSAGQHFAELGLEPGHLAPLSRAYEVLSPV